MKKCLRNNNGVLFTSSRKKYGNFVSFSAKNKIPFQRRHAMVHHEAIESFVDLLEKELTDCSAIIGRVFAKLTNGSSDPYALGECIFQWNRKYGDNFFEALRSRDALMKCLESLPDEAKALLPSIIRLYKLAPAIIKQEIMQTAHIVASENSVGVGRPKLFKSKYQEREVIIGVVQLIARGYSIGEAKKKTAMRHRVSLRTVEAIWKNRKTVDVAEPFTLADLFKDFQSVFRRAEESQHVP